MQAGRSSPSHAYWTSPSSSPGASTMRVNRQWQTPGGVRALGFTPDARFATVVTGEGRIVVHALAHGTASADQSFGMRAPAKVASISRDAWTIVALGQQGEPMRASIDWQLDFTDRRTAGVSALPGDVPWRGVDGLTSFTSGLAHRVRTWRLHWVAVLLLLALPLYYVGELFGAERTKAQLVEALRLPTGKGEAVALTTELCQDAITTLLEFINDKSHSPEERVTALEALGSLGAAAKTKVVEHVLVRTGRFDNFGEVRAAAADAESRIFTGE